MDGAAGGPPGAAPTGAAAGRPVSASANAARSDRRSPPEPTSDGSPTPGDAGSGEIASPDGVVPRGRTAPTVFEALREAERTLAAAGVEAAAFDARLLLRAATGWSAAEAVSENRRPLPDEARAVFETLVRQRATRRPLQHLTGRVEFYGLPLAVGPGALIPRPDTETLVEAVLDFLHRRQPPAGDTDEEMPTGDEAPLFAPKEKTAPGAPDDRKPPGGKTPAAVTGDEEPTGAPGDEAPLAGPNEMTLPGAPDEGAPTDGKTPPGGPKGRVAADAPLRIAPLRIAPLRIADVGCGAGPVALALADALAAPPRRAAGAPSPDESTVSSERPVRAANPAFPRSPGFVVGFEIASAALALADENRRENGLEERVALVRGDLLTAARPGSFAVVAANLPYVPRAEIERLEPEVRDHEPRAALDGGKDGLDPLRRLLPLAARALLPEGALFVEIGAGQDTEASRTLAAAGWMDLQTIPDLAGTPRVLAAKPPPPRTPDADDPESNPRPKPRRQNAPGWSPASPAQLQTVAATPPPHRSDGDDFRLPTRPKPRRERLRSDPRSRRRTPGARRHPPPHTRDADGPESNPRPKPRQQTAPG